MEDTNTPRRARVPFHGRNKAQRTADSRNGSLLLRTRGGTTVVLRHSLRSGGMRLRKNGPRGWRNVASRLSRGLSTPERRLNGWLLVLAAKKIPHILFPSGGFPRVYVPPLYEGVALYEINAFEVERPVPILAPPVRDNMGLVLGVFALLIFWHGLRWGWFTRLQLPSPPFPPTPEGWSACFGLDAYRTRTLHEWWRTVTALTLHADDKHILGNVGFGLFFFIPLCRRAGLGLGLALAVLAGILGNICNVLTRGPHFLSLGFSTALFGAVGCLCALTVCDVLEHHRRFSGMPQSGGSGIGFTLIRRLLIPLAAGMALLGILGGGGEVRTDYAAHIWGFCCGVVLTLLAKPLEKRIFQLEEPRQVSVQFGIFMGTMGVITAAWSIALWTGCSG